MSGNCPWLREKGSDPREGGDAVSGPGRGGAEGSGAAAAERGRAADCSPGTDTGLGGLRVPARSLEIKEQGGKTSGASFCCILGGVRPALLGLAMPFFARSHENLYFLSCALAPPPIRK